MPALYALTRPVRISARLLLACGTLWLMSRAVSVDAQELKSASVLPAGGVTASRVEDPVPSAEGRVLVTVRTIQAQGRIENTEVGSQPISMRIDGRLSDLADKLKHLPFRGFVYVAAEQRTVPVRKKELIPLVGGQTLALRPLYSQNNKIGLWLRWQDKAGAEILDTRMHFDAGQSMIAGTDLLNDPTDGLILAVQVAPGGD